MELKERIEKLEKELTEVKSLLEKEEYVVQLKIRDAYLYVGYYEDNIFKQFISISPSGKIRCTHTIQHYAYEKWIEEGAKIKQSKVEWGGYTYSLDKEGELNRDDIINGGIMNIHTLETYTYCGDTNIKRFKHNEKPIIY